MKIQSLRGMPDLFPEDLERWHIFESKLSKIFHSFNTHEIRTPLLESTELFSRSVGSSSDIVNKELYSFLDRNEESISLRPEGSASVIRAIIQKKQEHEKHKLWYQGPMFRYERPQKGRFRQFHQVGVEYLGFEEGVSEYELISMVLQINKLIGISDYTIKINHLGDQLAKESFCNSLVAFLQPHINELHEKDQARLKSNPLRVLDSKEKSTQELLKEGPKFQDFISNDSIFNILISSKLISDSTFVESIDLNKIESKVLEIPYIDKVSSSIDIQSNFSLEIVEKKPIIDLKDYDFYLSEKGERIPRIENKKLNIKSFFGKIDSIVFCDLASLAKYINNDNFFIEHIKYIYADSTSFYFSVNDYKYQVKLGNLNNYENKLKKYKGFYAAKVNTDLLKNFNKLDLNFNNQVIAQKK